MGGLECGTEHGTLFCHVASDCPRSLIVKDCASPEMVVAGCVVVRQQNYGREL